MTANTFNQFKIFSSANCKSIEDEINKFLDENAGRIKIIKRTMNVVSWAKRRSWAPVIQIAICYKEQKMSYCERIRVTHFDRGDARVHSEKWNKEMLADNREITDLLLSSVITDAQYSDVTCVLAVFIKCQCISGVCKA